MIAKLKVETISKTKKLERCSALYRTSLMNDRTVGKEAGYSAYRFLHLNISNPI